LEGEGFLLVCSKLCLNPPPYSFFVTVLSYHSITGYYHDTIIMAELEFSEALQFSVGTGSEA
jgi:hypothetical protein